ncbi:MAG: hypothetical protein PHD76_14420 [Methylacidiphilales bacterium]|nr:hypothetical protein [Candidatus Methylacidiphilales bacterium]
MKIFSRPWDAGRDAPLNSQPGRPRYTAEYDMETLKIPHEFCHDEA